MVPDIVVLETKTPLSALFWLETSQRLLPHLKAQATRPRWKRENPTGVGIPIGVHSGWGPPACRGKCIALCGFMSCGLKASAISHCGLLGQEAILCLVTPR